MAPSSPQASHVGLILPLCGSSATLGLALYQYAVFNSFLTSTPKTTGGSGSLAGKNLSRYWEPVMKQGYVVITGLGLTSTVSGILAARWLRTHQTLETTDVSNWYTYGSVLAALHFAFLPLVGGPIKRMMARGSDTDTLSEDKTEEENRTDMKTWFLWHSIRTVVDLAALYAFAEGAAQSFWVANA